MIIRPVNTKETKINPIARQDDFKSSRESVIFRITEVYYRFIGQVNNKMHFTVFMNTHRDLRK